MSHKLHHASTAQFASKADVQLEVTGLEVRGGTSECGGCSPSLAPCFLQQQYREFRKHIFKNVEDEVCCEKRLLASREDFHRMRVGWFFADGAGHSSPARPLREGGHLPSPPQQAGGLPWNPGSWARGGLPPRPHLHASVTQVPAPLAGTVQVSKGPWRHLSPIAYVKAAVSPGPLGLCINPVGLCPLIRCQDEGRGPLIAP